MSCYNPHVASDNRAGNRCAAGKPNTCPTGLSWRAAGVQWLRRFGAALLRSAQRRAAARVRFGRLLDAGWTKPLSAPDED